MGTNPHARRRLLLATIAAHGILAHNTAVEMPKAYSLRDISALLEGYEADELESDLARLTQDGLLRSWHTGHSGYGGAWVEGKDTWRVTPLGLVHLWRGMG